MAARKKTPAKRPRKRSRPPGRPSSYNRRIAAAVYRHLRNGLTMDESAAAVGVHASTLYKWQADFSEFAEGITRARESLKPKLFETITKGALKDPRLALQFAERLWPDRLFRGRLVKVEGNPDKPLSVSVSADEELAEVARKLAGMTTDELRALRRSPSP